MAAYFFAACRTDDMPCQDCDWSGQPWAFKADLVVTERAYSNGGTRQHYVCFRCFDRWREVPEQASLPPISRRALLTLYQPPNTDEMRVQVFR